MMKHRSWPQKARLIVFSLLGLAGTVGALWWLLFGLKPYDITHEQLTERYAHRMPTMAAPAAVEMQLGAPQRLTVLVEGESRQGAGQLFGRSTWNRIVNFAGGPELIGQIIPVRIIKNFRNSQLGEVVRMQAA